MKCPLKSHPDDKITVMQKVESVSIVAAVLFIGVAVAAVLL